MNVAADHHTDDPQGRSLLGALTFTERRRTTFELVVTTLRNAIVTGQIPGGTHLVQATVAEELGVSTTPVREALRQLAFEGILDFDPHRGAVVRTIDSKDMREVYGLRALLEPHCMRLAVVQISPEALRQAEELHQRMQVERNLGTWAELNRTFHGVLCDGARSPRLTGFLQSLRASDAQYVGVPLRAATHPTEVGNRDHGLLLAAFRNQDPDAAAAIALSHIRATIQVLEQEGHHVPVST